MVRIHFTYWKCLNFKPELELGVPLIIDVPQELSQLVGTFKKNSGKPLYFEFYVIFFIIYSSSNTTKTTHQSK